MAFYIIDKNKGNMFSNLWQKEIL